MDDDTQPPPDALAEALNLSETILGDIELGRGTLTSAALKCARLARLLNDFDYQQIMHHEVGGYPSSLAGMPQDAWRLAGLAHRHYAQKDTAGETKQYAYVESIEQLEQQQVIATHALAAAKDPDISLTSANPHQHLVSPTGNQWERHSLRQQADHGLRRLAERRAFLHSYALSKHYQLKFSGFAGDIFRRVRELVDGHVGAYAPDAVQKFTAVYEGLRSDNPENWANAVHSCRRILQDLADALFPTQPDRVVDGKTVKLGSENYVNRLVCFISENSESERFKDLVGSHLSFIGDRLDAVLRASQKGSHATVRRDEADRYVVYTYLLVGDILALKGERGGAAVKAARHAP